MRSRRPSQPRFLPQGHPSLVLDPDSAEQAIRSYNAHRRVQAQERAALAVLGSGFTRGDVTRQLLTLDTAYKTRSVKDDVIFIGTRVEGDFDRWQDLLRRVTPLIDGIIDPSALEELLGFFLDAGTRRKTRSLATKALHFASPQGFIPADSYAANLLGKILGAGSWADTAMLGTENMAVWYHDYLRVVQDIGAANRKHIAKLLVIDAQTATWPGYAHVRGWPKILDKILWWRGQPGSAAQRLFMTA